MAAWNRSSISTPATYNLPISTPAGLFLNQHTSILQLQPGPAFLNQHHQDTTPFLAQENYASEASRFSYAQGSRPYVLFQENQETCKPLAHLIIQLFRQTKRRRRRLLDWLWFFG